MRVGSLIRNKNTSAIGIVFEIDCRGGLFIHWLGSSMTDLQLNRIWNKDSIHLEVVCE